MALLLAMYQKMRLIREKNQATLDLTKFSSKYNRVSKNIERVQKRYTSLFAQLDAQAKQMQSYAKVMFQNQFGLGTSSVDLYNYTGMNGYVTNTMAQMLLNGGNPIPVTKRGADGKTEKTGEVTFTNDRIQQMLAEYMQNGGFVPKKQKNAETGIEEVVKDENGVVQYENGYSKEEIAFFMQAMQGAKMQQQQAQMACSNMSQAYEQNVSIWLDAAKAQLEAEQDAALEPLNYEQTMWELEKEQAEQKLTRIKAELESYTQLCSEEAKEQAPKFGLG